MDAAVMERKTAKKEEAEKTNVLSPLGPANAGSRRKKKRLRKKDLVSRLRRNARRESRRASERGTPPRATARASLRTRRAKRRCKPLTPQQWQARKNAEHETMRRRQCNLFQFWRVCPRKRCARARSCAGDAEACFTHWWRQLPEDMKQEYRDLVIAEAARRGITGAIATRA